MASLVLRFLVVDLTAILNLSLSVRFQLRYIANVNGCYIPSIFNINTVYPWKESEIKAIQEAIAQEEIR